MRAIINDSVGIAGFGLVGYGTYLAYPPASYIVLGLGLCVFALLATKHGKRP